MSLQMWTLGSIQKMIGYITELTEALDDMMYIQEDQRIHHASKTGTYVRLC